MFAYEVLTGSPFFADAEEAYAALALPAPHQSRQRSFALHHTYEAKFAALPDRNAAKFLKEVFVHASARATSLVAVLNAPSMTAVMRQSGADVRRVSEQVAEVQEQTMRVEEIVLEHQAARELGI